MKERIYTPRYSFTPEASCYCGSGNQFGECCGRPGPNKPVPAGIYIVQNFLSREECAAVVDYAEQRERQWLLVADLEKSTKEKTAWKRDDRRVTQYVDMGDQQKQLEQWMIRAVQQYVNPRTGMTIESFEPPCMMRYGEGGRYTDHVDGEAYDEEKGQWYRAVDRDISLLIYFNDGYEGGGLKFNNLNFTYQPRAGDLAFFPSNYIFRHESLPITRGTKYACVSWSMAAGTPRVGKSNESPGQNTQ